ncbi:MAG: phosphate acyltransferase PlsX [Pseudomonadales bacterium]
MQIAIDVMGGDFGPSVIVRAAIELLSERNDLALQLYGDVSRIEPLIDADYRDRIEVTTASSLNPHECDGKAVLLHGRGSSLFKAIDAVAKGRADVCVSAGSSAALMVVGLRLLGTLPGLKRPAICKAFPTANGHTYLLDLGANAECDAQALTQFALMGSALAAERDGRKKPTVRLLSNGSEPTKGTRVIREAAKMLTVESQINYQGFIEPDELFTTTSDIIVCDGFSGNVALKSCEGTASMLLAQFRQLFADHSSDVSKGLDDLDRRFSPARHNGAFFLGVNGIVVKSHGDAGPAAILNCLQEAERLGRSNWLASVQGVLT